jgi:hypothetical protein
MPVPDVNREQSVPVTETQRNNPLRALGVSDCCLALLSWWLFQQVNT